MTALIVRTSDITAQVDDLFNFEDLSGTYSVADITLSMALALVLTATIGFVYRKTHRGTSYTQSYVQTLVMMGMIVSVVMLVVGSNLARAFSLVGALSIVRFRNAVKETRDVGYIFFAMAVGMATGTRFYVLAVVATVVICLAMLVMVRFDLFAQRGGTLVLKVQVPSDSSWETTLDDVLVRHTTESSLVSVDSTRSGLLTELVYAVRLRPTTTLQAVLRDVQDVNGNQRVSLITGYDSSDL